MQNLKTLILLGAEKSEMENFEKKENGQTKDMISIKMIILSYTIQQVILSIFKFQDPR